MKLRLIAFMLSKFEFMRDFLAHQVNIRNGFLITRHQVASIVADAHDLACVFKEVFMVAVKATPDGTSSGAEGA